MSKPAFNYVFSEKCALCGRITDGFPLCDVCRTRIRRNRFLCCEICGRPTAYCICREKSPSYIRCAAAFIYDDETIKSLAFKLKKYGSASIAAFFGQSVSRLVSEKYSDVCFDFVTYVPPTRFLTIKKGFDHSALIARKVSVILKIPFCTPPVIKKGRPMVQKLLGSGERLDNASKIYEQRGCISGKVLLVDDVTTTGATFDICSALLKQAGASEVYCAAVAMTPKKKKIH